MRQGENRMIYDYYRIFYYVAVYKSFSQAAKVLNNNQPNITRCMNILENELFRYVFILKYKTIQTNILLKNKQYFFP